MHILNFISQHSALLMVLATVFGFIFPRASDAVLPYLPMILFFIMFFTLMAIDQKALLRTLSQPSAWIYALIHSVGMSILSLSTCYLLGIRDDLLLAVAATMASGSLFATPAIVRSIGFNPMFAMAITISSTLIMPVVLFINLYLFQTADVNIDMVLYMKRLTIFIFGPMLTAALIHHFVAEETLQRAHQQLSKFTMLFVIAFPFGLIGSFRWEFNQEPIYALGLLFLSTAIVTVLFWLNFYLYQRSSIERRISVAVASGGRNVLLTFTIAGPFLGTQFLPLIGAMQFPIYVLPIVSRLWMRWQEYRHHRHAPNKMSSEDDIVL